MDFEQVTFVNGLEGLPNSLPARASLLNLTFYLIEPCEQAIFVKLTQLSSADLNGMVSDRHA